MLGSIKGYIGLVLGIAAFAAPTSAAVLTTFSVTSTNGSWQQSAPTAEGAAPFEYHFNNANTFKLDWTGTVDADPIISSSLSLTNNTNATQTYTTTLTLPISPALTGATLRGGSISGGASDGNGDGVTVATVPGSALYTALTDGLPAHTLLPFPYVSSAPAFNPAVIGPAIFGGPIPPTTPGGPVLSSIGIELKFTLTPGDSVAITSVFVVTPEPASLSVLALAGVGLLARRRRA